MRKKILCIFSGFIAYLFLTPLTFAHVLVNPSQTGIASIQVFDMSVPTEKSIPTTTVKLHIPPGLTDVTPNVKPGWSINMVKTGDTVTEIEWTNGSIPTGERDDFLFQAQVPAKQITLEWKAYQIYADGSIVAWDHAPTGNPNDDSAHPYSITKVINDLNGSIQITGQGFLPEVSLILSSAALALSVLALIMRLRKS